MYRPAEHNEITGLLHYLDQQLDALRASAFGLTEAQSRETPCRSSLSIAGLIKHAAYVKAALSILTVEARHASAIGLLNGSKGTLTPNGAFDTPFTAEKVLAAVKSTGFIVG